MFERWGRLVFRFRWLTLALALVALGLSIFSIALGQGNGTNNSASTMESDRAAALVRSELPQVAGQGSSLILLFSDPHATATDPAFKDALTAAVAPLHSDSRVTGVTTPYDPGGAGFVSRGRHEAVALVRLRDRTSVALKEVGSITAAVHPGRLHMVVTGDAPISDAFLNRLQDDLGRAELIALPLALLLLVLIFRSAVAACIPVAVGALTIIGGVGFTMALSRVTPISPYAYNIVTLVGLGVSIDYSLILVSRFREELETGAAKKSAVAHTLGTAGRAITFSGFTVATGLLSMVFFGTGFAQIGYATAATVAIAVIYGLTLLPATLAVVGGGVNRLRLPWQRSVSSQGFWHWTAVNVMRRPLAFLIPCAVLLLAAGAPVLQMRLAATGTDSLPAQDTARQGYDSLVRDFAAFGSNQFDVVAYYPGSTPPAAAVAELRQRLAAIPGVVSLGPSVTGKHLMLLEANTNLDPSGDPARAAVRAIRALHLAGGGQLLVGGQTAADLDSIAFLGDHFPAALAFVFVVSYVVLLAMTGSVILPLKAVLTNLLSISAGFGALAWIFVQGHLSGLLHFTPQPIDPAMPVLMFALMFGLSMDYEVLLLARIQERWRATGNTTQAVAEGLERSGRLITGAAAIMVGVFAAWGLADVVLLKALGVGIAVAIMLDATVVRALVVPSVMRLLGDANWWAPRPLARLRGLPRLESTPELAA